MAGESRAGHRGVLGYRCRDCRRAAAAARRSVSALDDRTCWTRCSQTAAARSLHARPGPSTSPSSTASSSSCRRSSPSSVASMCSSTMRAAPSDRRRSHVPWSDVEYTTKLNYLSPIRLTMAVLPAMLARGAGKVLTVSSMAARTSTPGEGHVRRCEVGPLGVHGGTRSRAVGHRGRLPPCVSRADRPHARGMDGDDSIAETVREPTGSRRPCSPAPCAASLKPVTSTLHAALDGGTSPKTGPGISARRWSPWPVSTSRTDCTDLPWCRQRHTGDDPPSHGRQGELLAGRPGPRTRPPCAVR